MDAKLARLEAAITRARLALGWERLWPRLVPLLSLLGIYVALSWFGFWRVAGEWGRLGVLIVLAGAIL
jgi:hypothetical protein